MGRKSFEILKTVLSGPALVALLQRVAHLATSEDMGVLERGELEDFLLSTSFTFRRLLPDIAAADLAAASLAFGRLAYKHDAVFAGIGKEAAARLRVMTVEQACAVVEGMSLARFYPPEGGAPVPADPLGSGLGLNQLLSPARGRSVLPQPFRIAASNLKVTLPRRVSNRLMRVD